MLKSKKHVKSAKKISVSLKECGIVLGAGMNYCPPRHDSCLSSAIVGSVDARLDDRRVVKINNPI